MLVVNQVLEETAGYLSQLLVYCIDNVRRPIELLQGFVFEGHAPSSTQVLT
jgi:hypothetical protein